MRIAIFSALPQELTWLSKDSVIDHKPGRNSFPVLLSKHGHTELTGVETGMNTCGLEPAFRHVMAEYRPDIVVSAGFGGALYYRAKIGEVVLASRFFFYTREGAIELPQVSVQNAHFQKILWNGAVLPKLQQKVPIKEGTFLTLREYVPKARLKTAMPERTACAVCDRETVYLANLAYNSNVPFLAVRAITDLADEDIPEELYRVTDATGRYCLSRALSLLASRPSLIPCALKLGRNAAAAARSLGETVRALAEVTGSSRAPLHAIRKPYPLRMGR